MNTTQNTIDESAVLLETSSLNAKLVNERRSCSGSAARAKRIPTSRKQMDQHRCVKSESRPFARISELKEHNRGDLHTPEPSV